MMKKKNTIYVCLTVVCLSSFHAICMNHSDKAPEDRYILRWMEKPLQKGSSKKAKPEDRVKFSLVCSYDRKEGTDAFNKVTSLLREGDVPLSYSLFLIHHIAHII